MSRAKTAPCGVIALIGMGLADFPGKPYNCSAPFRFMFTLYIIGIPYEEVVLFIQGRES
jgi:hypothetical protein